MDTNRDMEPPLDSSALAHWNSPTQDTYLVEMLAATADTSAGTSNSDAQQVSAGSSGSPDLAAILAFAERIADKRYDLYHWCEQKVYTLATIDGILFAGVFLLVIRVPDQARYVFLAAAIETMTCLIISLTLALWHVNPLMDAKVGNSTNPRTVIGVESFRTADAYHQALLRLDIHKMIRYTAFQIRGMNRNIWRDHKAIRWAVRASLLSLVGLAAMVLLEVFA